MELVTTTATEHREGIGTWRLETTDIPWSQMNRDQKNAVVAAHVCGYRLVTLARGDRRTLQVIIPEGEPIRSRIPPRIGGPFPQPVIEASWPVNMQEMLDNKLPVAFIPDYIGDWRYTHLLVEMMRSRLFSTKRRFFLALQWLHPVEGEQRVFIAYPDALLHLTREDICIAALAASNVAVGVLDVAALRDAAGRGSYLVREMHLMGL